MVLPLVNFMAFVHESKYKSYIVVLAVANARQRYRV